MKSVISSFTRKNFFKYLTLLVGINLIIAFALTITFMHIHILPNGQIIYHSHALPSHSHPGKDHTHTKLEFLFYHLSTVLKLFIISIFLFSHGKTLLSILQRFFNNPHRQIKVYTHYLRRAPPSSS